MIRGETGKIARLKDDNNNFKYIQTATDRLLDHVLFKASNGMKNAFSRAEECSD